jgi:hypothetical protein
MEDEERAASVAPSRRRSKSKRTAVDDHRAPILRRSLDSGRHPARVRTIRAAEMTGAITARRRATSNEVARNCRPIARPSRIVIAVVSRVFAIVLAIAAVADASPHRNAGTYTLTRGARRTHGDPETGVATPACKPDEPIPTELIIKYDGPESPVVLVNEEEWKRSGLTTGPRGEPHSHPSRIADKPEPPPGTHVSVWFRRDGAQASGSMQVYRLGGKRGVTCVTVFGFAGTYSP